VATQVRQNVLHQLLPLFLLCDVQCRLDHKVCESVVEKLRKHLGLGDLDQHVLSCIWVSHFEALFHDIRAEFLSAQFGDRSKEVADQLVRLLFCGVFVEDVLNDVVSEGVLN